MTGPRQSRAGRGKGAFPGARQVLKIAATQLLTVVAQLAKQAEIFELLYV